MKTRIVLALVAATITLSALAQEAPPKPVELKILDRLIGTWDTKAMGKVAPWTPVEFRTTGRISFEWVLEGRLVMGKGTDTSPAQVMVTWTFDQHRKVYRTNYYSSKGDLMDWSGDWKTETQTFVVKSSMDNGITATLTLRCANKDLIEWTGVAADAAGKIYHEMSGSWTRVKP